MNLSMQTENGLASQFLGDSRKAARHFIISFLLLSLLCSVRLEIHHMGNAGDFPFYLFFPHYSLSLSVYVVGSASAIPLCAILEGYCEDF